MSKPVTASKPAPFLQLYTALDHTQKACKFKLGQPVDGTFYLGPQFQLLTSQPKTEASKQELLEHLKEVAGHSDEKEKALLERKITVVLELMFKPKVQSDEKKAVAPTITPSPSVRAVTAPAAPPAAASSSVSAPVSAIDTTVLEAINRPVFEKYRVRLNGVHCYSEKTNDFGIRIRKLRISKPHDAPGIVKLEQKATSGPKKSGKAEVLSEVFNLGRFYWGAKNLQAFAKELGIDVEFASEHYYVRDHLYHDGRGGISTFTYSKNAGLALDRARSCSLYLGNDSAFLTRHDHFDDCQGGFTKWWKEGVTDLEKLLGPGKVKLLSIYVEGGNLFKVTHPTNPDRRVLFIGECGFFQTLNTMRLDKRFDAFAEILQQKVLKVQETITPAQLRQGAIEMYAQGLLLPDGNCGFVDSETLTQLFRAGKAMPQTSGENIFLKLAAAKGIPPFNFTEAQLKKAEPNVVKYLAQKEVVKLVIATLLGAHEKDLHILPQVGYHLDVFTRPGPKASFLLQSFKFCADHLKQIAEKADVLKLTDKDRKMLVRYIKTADQLAHDFEPLVPKTREIIEGAGYTVIDTPANYYDVSSRELDSQAALDGRPRTHHVNFMNALSGWEKGFYFMTSGAQVGDKLGQVLMKSFKQFLNQYEKMDVRFGGGNPADPNDFSEAMGWWNTDTRAGFHCCGFEEVTESYRPAVAP